MNDLSIAFTDYGKKNRRYIFVFGASLCSDFLASRGLSPKLVTVAQLKDHQLGFFGCSRVWDGAVAAALPSPGNTVWGAIYEQSFREAYLMDSFADARLDGTGTSFHYPVEVTDQSDRCHTVLMYKKDSPGSPGIPSSRYLETILKGAAERELPSFWLQSIKSWPVRTADYPVPLPDRFFKAGSSDNLSCAGCA